MNNNKYHLHIRYTRLVAFGILEQGISSIASFTFTVLLAKGLQPAYFGEFSIAWAWVMLAETLLGASFGGSVPAIANKLHVSRWSKFRGASYITSACLSGFLCLILLAVSAVTFRSNHEISELVATSAFSIVALRMQQTFRRLCYLDERRAYALIGSAAYASVLMLIIFVLTKWQIETPASAMLGWGLAMAASSTTAVFGNNNCAMPDNRTIRWFLTRSFRSGKWLVVSGFLYWISSVSLIPIGGMLFGVEAGGAFRLLQNLMVPLLQTNAVLVTVISPVAAKQLKGPGIKKMNAIFAGCLAIFVGISVIYSISITVFGESIVRLIYSSSYQTISTSAIALMSISTIAEAVRTSAATVLLAIDNTKPIFFGWLASAFFTFALLPVSLYLEDIVALPLVLSFGSISAATTLCLLLLRYSDSLRLKPMI